MVQPNKDKIVTRKGSLKSTSKDFEPAYLCGKCNRTITDDPQNGEENSIQCFICRKWFHQKRCTDLSDQSYQFLAKTRGVQWTCEECESTNGKEASKLANIEMTLQLMMQKFESMEDSLMRKIDDRIEEKIEEKIGQIEKNLETRMEERMEETEERKKRENNIIITGLIESSDTTHQGRQEDDEKEIRHMINSICPTPKEDVKSVTRLGPLRTGSGVRARKIRVVLASQDVKKAILTGQRKLNANTANRKDYIYINHDLTPLEQQKDKELRDELKTRRSNGEEDLIIRNGKIVKRERREERNEEPAERH